MLRWFLNFLYGSTAAEFESVFSIEESIARLSAATKTSVFKAISHQAAVGSVNDKKVSLQRVIPFVGNSFKPIFVGSFRCVGSKTVLLGHFTMHWVVKAFLTFWFGFCALWTILATSAAIADPRSAWFAPIFGIGLFAAGVALVRVGQWFARNDIDWLSSLISKVLSK